MDIAFTLLGPIMLGAFIGHKLDTPGGFPKWTVIFTFLGMATGFWSVYKRYSN